MKRFFMLFIALLMFFIAETAFADTASDVANLPTWVLVAGLAMIIVEYILGKTTWIKPNSILDIVFQVLIKIIKAVLPVKK